MASFFYPNRSSPTYTFDITPLETYPARRPKTKPQFLDVMPDGTKKHQGLGNARQEIVLEINRLAIIDKYLFVYFIETIVEWAAKNFDFTDDQGWNYNNCFFMFSQHDFKMNRLNLFSAQIRMMVEST